MAEISGKCLMTFLLSFHFDFDAVSRSDREKKRHCRYIIKFFVFASRWNHLESGLTVRNKTRMKNMEITMFLESNFYHWWLCVFQSGLYISPILLTAQVNTSYQSSRGLQGWSSRQIIWTVKKSSFQHMCALITPFSALASIVRLF